MTTYPVQSVNEIHDYLVEYRNNLGLGKEYVIGASIGEYYVLINDVKVCSSPYPSVITEFLSAKVSDTMSTDTMTETKAKLYTENFLEWHAKNKARILSTKQVQDHLWVVFTYCPVDGYKTQLFNADAVGIGNTYYHASHDEGLKSFTNRVKTYSRR